MRACLLAIVCAACGSRTELWTPPDASPPLVDASQDVAHAEDVAVAPDVEVAPTVLVTTDVPMYAITVDDENVYWTQGYWKLPTTPTFPVAMQCNKKSCKTPIVLGTGANDVPLSIAVDPTTVYWTTHAWSFDDDAGFPYGLFGCAIGGCASPQTIIDGPVRAVAARPGRLFWTDANNVDFCSVGDCAASTTSLGPGGIGVRIDGDYAYWSAPSAIMRCRLSQTGCASAPVVVVPDSPSDGNPNVPNLRPFAIDGANVYWTSNGVLSRCPKEGCSSPTVIMPFGNTSAQCIATDGINVYWTAPNAVVRCPVTGCAKPIRVYMSFPHSPPLPSPNCVAVDETNVYWTTGEIGFYSGPTIPNEGSIMTVPK